MIVNCVFQHSKILLFYRAGNNIPTRKAARAISNCLKAFKQWDGARSKQLTPTSGTVHWMRDRSRLWFSTSLLGSLCSTHWFVPPCLLDYRTVNSSSPCIHTCEEEQRLQYIIIIHFSFFLMYSARFDIWYISGQFRLIWYDGSKMNWVATIYSLEFT
jgi:hypothetical protein